MLLDSAERLDHDRTIREALNQLRRGQVRQVSDSRRLQRTLIGHVFKLALDRRTDRLPKSARRCCRDRALRQNDPVPEVDMDAIVIGAGHNGLVTAAYLARAGLRTTLLEARASVGGTAGSEEYGGAVLNICNCDHLTFRTTPVLDELSLAAHGLRYLDVDPSQLNMTWDEQQPWPIFHDVDETIEALSLLHPGEVEGYRRYVAAAVPAVKLVLAAAAEPPSTMGLVGTVLKRRGRGASTLMRWSQSSAADVMRSFFSTEALRAPALAVGPMVWGISPETPRSGLGALTYAMRHVVTVGRPEGGSGALPEAIARAFAAYGGDLRLQSRVSTILCDNTGVIGVGLDDGTELRSTTVVSACDPKRTFVEWLSGAPAMAADLIERWRTAPHVQGYESKVDAVLSAAPRLRATETENFARLGIDVAACTSVVAPSLAEMHRGYTLMGGGKILPKPALLVNVPTVMDPTMAPPDRHVLSLEALYTPYSFEGGWDDNVEARRWLGLYADLVQPGFLDSIEQWRVMTPLNYEREFNLPGGHATSFVGGPLAALHNKNPELTSYQTSVPGLYITGAATFPGAGIWGASGRNAAQVILRNIG